jgi:serine/threonine protein kinase
MAPMRTDGGEVERLYGAELGAGALVGQYVVDALAASGGFGTVYRGRHQSRPRAAAIKLLHEYVASSETSVRRFEQEAEVIGRLHHPNVVEIFEVGQLTDGRPYLVMEWLDGHTLAELVARRGALPLDEVAALARPLCAGLAAIHDAGIVHRDLKASNVMAGTFGVKLIDFGVVKLLDASERLTRTGARVGTPTAMAPEQILGAEVTCATDVYACGVLLYQLLTGHLPFDATTLEDLEALHLHATPPRVSRRVAVPAIVDDVVLRCLEKEPLRRFASARELAAALARAAAGEPTRKPGLAAQERRALALRVDGEVAAVAAARSMIERAGLLPAIMQPDLLLVVAEEPACTSLDELALRLGEQPGLQVRVRSGMVTALVIDGMPVYVGGELLDLLTWH